MLKGLWQCNSIQTVIENELLKWLVPKGHSLLTLGELFDFLP